MDNIQKRLVNSFTDYELKDYISICRQLDHSVPDKFEQNIIILSKDPYLFLLLFTGLIRFRNISLHLLNPEEGQNEIQRLIYVIQPDMVISTSHEFVCGLYGCDMMIIDPSKVDQSFNERYPVIVQDVAFDIVTYSPTPVRINIIHSEIFESLVNSLMLDLHKFDLVDFSDMGLTSIVSNDTEYLLYFISLKLLRPCFILPTEEEYKWCLTNKKEYFLRNKSETLYITKKEFVELWEQEISSLFQYRFIFSCYSQSPWITNLLIRRKLKKLFKGFKKVLIIGILNNSFMVDVLNNLHSIKFYSIFPLEKVLMYGSISQSLNSIIISSNDFRQDHFALLKEFTNCSVYNHNIRLQKRLVSDTKSVFIKGPDIKSDGEKREQYFLLGNKDNAFYNKNVLLFPETLERVINSYPFIRYSAFITFQNKQYLIVCPNDEILDANRINHGAFNTIIKNQIAVLNHDLPEEYKIQGFLVTRNLLEINRFGEISKFALNQCNK
jgi:hypothetical protein